MIAIPKDYLVSDTQVETKDGLIEVELGVDNLDMVEVISGIEEGTVIYKPDQ